MSDAGAEVAKREFEITFEGTIVIPVADLWPDNDWPEDPTTDDVKALMERCGSKLSVLADWDLLDDAYIRVGVSAMGKDYRRVWDQR